MTIRDIFNDLSYGTAPESATEAYDFIARHKGQFGCFIDGKFTRDGARFNTYNPASGAPLAEVTQATTSDIDKAIKAARRAQAPWAALHAHKRALYIYGLARLVQKHALLFAVLETLDTGKPIRESRDIDIPLVSRHFYYHAGLAQLLPSEAPDLEPLGVCAAVIPWNFPLLMLAWKVAPALAACNTVVLKPAEFTTLTALLFAQITREAGLPKGVFNIVTGDGAVGAALVEHGGVNKVAFTGSTEVGRKIRRATAGSGKALTLELGGKSPFIVFEDADLDSAVEGLVDAIWFNQGQVCCAGSRLLVQEGVADQFYEKLRVRMDKLRVGNPLDKSIDMGAIIDPSQKDAIAAMVDANQEGETYVSKSPLPEGCFYPPTLITGLHSASHLMQEEIFGPVLVATTFRTPSEAVDLANNSRYGLAASVWSETLNLALDVAPKLRAGVVWVNGTNMFDAAAGFGGVGESGFGREGGWEGLRAYLKPKLQNGPNQTPILPLSAPQNLQVTTIDRTAKQFINGKQQRPDSGYSTAIWSRSGHLLSHVGIGNRKDLRNAVEAAQSAQNWGSTTAHLRGQILYYMAENLSARADEFAQRLKNMTGKPGHDEVTLAISRLFTYAAFADKFDGTVKSVPIRGVAMAMNMPCGVIAAICPDEAPLLGFVSLMAPIIAMGNRAVLVPSEAFPLSATDFYQVLETSDLPAGVVNIVTGAHQTLAPVVAGHMDIDAVWSFSSKDLSAQIEELAAGNLKRTWVNYRKSTDWFSPKAEGRRFLEAATEVKTLWIPYGA